MTQALVEFAVPGSPKAVSQVIEEVAAGLGSLSAIVVPWESNHLNIVMAVTSTHGEGRFLEHTDLGTVLLTDLRNDTTRVVIEARPQEHAEKQKMAALFVRFTSQIQSRFQVAS
jgi:hypothetical protein